MLPDMLSVYQLCSDRVADTSPRCTTTNPATSSSGTIPPSSIVQAVTREKAGQGNMSGTSASE